MFLKDLEELDKVTVL